MNDRRAWIALALTAALLVAAWRFLALVGFNDDHYVHLAGAQQIAFGEWPSRDFVDAGAPLMLLLSAVVFVLTPGTPLFGEAVLVGVMFGIGAAATVYAVKRLTGSWWLALLAVGLEILIFPRTYSYPKVVAYALAFVAMWRYVDRPTVARLAQIACVTVAALLLRYDHGVYLGFGSAVAVILTSPRLRDSLRPLGVYALIAAALLTPYVIYVQIYDGLARHLRRGAEASAIENSRGRHAPAFVFERGDLTVNAVPWLYYEFHLLPLATAGVLAVRWRRSRDRRELAMVASLLAVAVPGNMGLIRETLSARLPDVVVPAVLQLVWLLSCGRALRPVRVAVPVWAAAVLLIVCTGASAMVLGATKEQLDRAEVFAGLMRIGRQFQIRAAQLRSRFPLEQIPSRTAYALLPFFAYVDRCLRPADHILVPAFLPEVLVWARRPFAGGQITFQPGVLATEDDHRLVLQRLNAQRVPLTVMNPASDAIAAQFDGLATYLKTHFAEYVIVDVAGGEPIRIGFNAQLAVGRDRDSGWYCYR